MSEIKLIAWGESQDKMMELMIERDRLRSDLAVVVGAMEWCLTQPNRDARIFKLKEALAKIKDEE